jgi:hypothetical protein
MKNKKLLTALSFLAFSIAGATQAATYDVFNNSASGDGTLRAAVAAANANSGPDIIEISASFDDQNPIRVDVGFGASGQASENPIEITDDVIIRGKGSDRSVIDDHQYWITNSGQTDGYPFDSSSTVIRPSGSLFKINDNNIAGRTIDVTIENITMSGLGGLLQTDNANVILDNVLVNNIVANKLGKSLVTHGGGGSLTIKDSLLFENRSAESTSLFTLLNDLTIVNSAFSANLGGLVEDSGSRLIDMFTTTGGNVLIRDSYFDNLEQSAILIDGFDVEITNTLLDGRSPIYARGIKVIDGDLTLTNSTLYYRPKTAGGFETVYQGTHIELAGSAQLIASNNLILSTSASSNTKPLIFPADWDNIATYPRAINQNNYISAVGGDDSALNMAPANCSTRKCFIPNTLSVALVDQGNSAAALYGDGAPIIEDYLKEARPQGVAIDIGAYEKHETLDPHADHYQTDEGVNLNVIAANGVLANDTTPGGLDVVLSQQALHGTVTLNADGSFDYVPNDGYYGQDEFEYELAGKQAAVTVEVRSTGWLLIPDNQQPVASADSYIVYTSDVLSITAPGLLLNDTDAQNTVAPFYAGLTVRLHEEPTHGSVVINEDGSFTYTPEAGYVGRDTFIYDAVDDGLMHSIPQTVGITVKQGDAPGTVIGEAQIGTSGGAISWVFLTSLLGLVMLRLKNMKALLLMVLTFTFLVSANLQADEIKASNDKGLYVDLGLGISHLSPDLGSTEWQQDEEIQPIFGFGIGYQFDDQWSADLKYHWLNHARLESDDVNYGDTVIHYHMFSASGKYRINQLWGSEYAPFLIVGASYLDPVISGDSALINVEHNIQIDYGFGINLSNTKEGRIDLGWRRISGDVQLLELTFAINIIN